MRGGLVLALLEAGLGPAARADVYLNNPRGSNNKLSEQSNNAQNQDRLFDSQNNAAGGYQVGDDCKPVCQNNNRDYDANKPGAMQGMMKYYKGSELYIEWTNQHGCGVDQPNLVCQFIIQYMCEGDNSGIRDGTKRGNQNTAGGQQEPPTTQQSDLTLGEHESKDFYIECQARERNKGLYTADQNMNNNRGATATRQNPNGNVANNRHGLECPEERDYYPYWHPTPWHDIAVITSEPNERCDYYQAESQNVKSKGKCSIAQFNNPKDCGGGGGSWNEAAAFGQDPAECFGGIASRDNHLGNVREGFPMYYVWKIPDENVEGKCTLRLRYNISTADFMPETTATSEGPIFTKRDIDDHFFVDARFNGGRRRQGKHKGDLPLLPQDPYADFVDLGPQNSLKLQVNTNQYGRTFEDRTHVFRVEDRPDKVAWGKRIVNYNVRGRRGNIVQVYPSVEYDFVPEDITVETGDYLHFQWAGSDANPKGNAGNGRQGTDRSNLVQAATKQENVPLPWDKNTLFLDESGEPDKAIIERFAYLNQHSVVTCDPDENNDQETDNCKQLNGASAYFDGGLVEMRTTGQMDIISTRNNDFSNRSQKGRIFVIFRWRWWWLLVGVLCVLMFLLLVYLAVAVYAYMRPTSFAFRREYRPRLLYWVVPAEKLSAKRAERRAYFDAEDQKWREQKAATEALAAASMAPPQAVGRGMGSISEPQGATAKRQATLEKLEFTKPAGEETTSHMVRCAKRCRERCGNAGICGLCSSFFGGLCLACSKAASGRTGLSRRGLAAYLLLNLGWFLAGVVHNRDGGFRGSSAFPVAKGAGYSLDFNFAVLVLPTLKTLQTMVHGGGSSEGIAAAIEDPIAFHIFVATLICIESLIHITAHIVHSVQIAQAPLLQTDPYAHWRLRGDEQVSSMPVHIQWFTPDLHAWMAPLSGILIFVFMAVMAITAMSCCRRGTNVVSRFAGGYRCFWRFHRFWWLVYALLLIHCPLRLWIWLFFPCVLFLIDRSSMQQQQRSNIVLQEVQLLQRDVIQLSFDVPEGFAYQAGQYVRICWRGEWHPFTLTSAPEEGHLSVHIRSPDALDWCSALRKRLVTEAPLARGAKHAGSKPKPGTVIRYEQRYDARTAQIYCRPAFFGEERLGRDVEDPATEITQEDSALSFEAAVELPADSVQIQLWGPFGAPAQQVWEYQTVMVVGAGIGVTPFVSILKSASARTRVRRAVLGAAGPASATKPRFKKRVVKNGAKRAPTAPAEKEMSPPRLRTASPAPSRGSARLSVGGISQAISETEHLVDLVAVVPRKIYFYWICAGQEEFDWFYSLLKESSRDAGDLVEISLFVTREIELSKVKVLEGVTHQYFGRPNWARIFKGVKEEHIGEHIGVFLCGSPMIGAELDRNSEENSDAHTQFSFYKENF